MLYSACDSLEAMQPFVVFEAREVAMTRVGKILREYWVIVFVFLLVGYVIVFRPKFPAHVQAASPDGSWSVLLFASKYADTGIAQCSYEMNVNLLDSKGRVLGCKRVGFASDLASAERDFAVTFESNEVVRIGHKRFKKEDLK